MPRVVLAYREFYTVLIYTTVIHPYFDERLYFGAVPWPVFWFLSIVHVCMFSLFARSGSYIPIK
jgi:hypothetical protein